MKPGTQIIYVPTHAENDKSHQDCETGFVTSIHKNGEAAFCRYWKHRNGHGGMLRTVSCSELTPLDMLVVENTVLQHVVEKALNEIAKEQA